MFKKILEYIENKSIWGRKRKKEGRLRDISIIIKYKLFMVKYWIYKKLGFSSDYFFDKMSKNIK